MPLLQLRDITLSFSAKPLLDGANLQIDAGERICLVGRNGAGKTSLLRLMTGEETPQAGEIIRPSGLALSRLPQEVPEGLRGSVYDVVHGGLRLAGHEEPWQADVRAEELMDEMGLPVTADFAALSGGLKRRVLLARALAAQPDILLLDEPTNHLDLDSILWLEAFLLRVRPTLFFITHDRAFLRRLATRIVELDRGRLTSWACDYDTFLERRNAALEAEEKQRAAFDKKLAQEEAWLRQGVKARRTRNEGRVRALLALRQERAARRAREGTARLGLSTAGASGQKVIEAKNVTFGYGGAPVVRDFNSTIWRGDKIGIIGANGSGKTTLLRLLLGQLAPEAGEVQLGTQLQIVYLDQLRGQIDDAKTVGENVAGDAETVTFQGRPRHIHSYLQDFLFPADRIRMKAKMLSGGERNRLLLARLFLQPANVLVLDEPTNDLDAETLELLEDLLVEYQGTLLLVSHDRAFLDEVVTGTLVFEGEGRVTEYTGGYEDWLRQRPAAPTRAPETKAAPPEKPPAKTGRAKKMLNRDRRELDELPAQIEQLEAERAALSRKLEDPALYPNGGAPAREVQAQLAALGGHPGGPVHALGGTRNRARRPGGRGIAGPTFSFSRGPFPFPNIPMKTKTIAAQTSWTFGTPQVQAALTCQGGHLGPVRFKLGRRWVDPFDLAPWAEEKKKDTPLLLQIMRGDFFCLPFGGNDTAWRGEKHAPHGEPAQAPWKHEGSSGSSHHFSMQTKARRGRVDKFIELVPGQTAIYQRHVISGMTGPMPLGHHAILRFAGEGAARVSMSPFRFGQVMPTRFENPVQGGYQSLKIGASFRALDRVPMADGGTADLSTYPAREGFEDLVLTASDPKLPWAWTAATVAAGRYVWFALKDPRVLRSTVLWHSNGGRHYAPWSGRHRHCLGLEDVTANFAYGLAESAKPNALNRRGLATTIALSPKKPTVVNYIMALAEIPAGFDIVKSIVATKDGRGVELTSKSGRKARAEVNLPFLFLSR